MPRISPLSPPYVDAIQESFDQILPPGVDPLLLFRTMAKSDRAWRKFRAGALLDPGPLGLREREIVINRTCAQTRCDYEWGVHVALLAGPAELTPEQLHALATGPANAPCWSEPESALIATADALHERATLDDAEWRDLRRYYDDGQTLEVIMLCGYYRTVAYLANGLALTCEPGATPIPA
jgi:alkylhydroperoxidase family enzyme